MIDFLVEYAPTFLSVLVGALVTFVAARIYYQKASKDLFDEAQELRRLNNLTLRAMEEAGLCEFNTDENGNVRGLKISLSGHIRSSSSMSATPSVTRRNENKI
jgi:hypothetical protein